MKERQLRIFAATVLGLAIIFFCASPLFAQEGGKQNVDDLIKKLGDKDAAVRLEAIKALGELKDPKAIDPLVAIVSGDDSEDIRGAAQEALAKMGDASVEALVKALKKEKKETISEKIVRLLGKLKNSRAVEPLIELLKNSDSELLKAAVKALVEIKDAKSIEPLINLLKNKSGEIRKVAAEGIKALGGMAVDYLLKALGETDPDFRAEVIDLLGQLKDGKTLEPLMNLLTDENSHIRKRVIGALMQFKDSRIAQPLVKMLGDVEQEVREMAQSALEKLGDAAGDALAKALGDDNEKIRAASKELIMKLGASVVDSLIKALKDESIRVRESAVELLGEIKDSKSIEPLSDLASKDKEESIRKAAMKALDRIKTALITPFVKALTDPDSKTAEAAKTVLLELGAKGLSLLEGMLESEKDENVKDALKKVIEEIKARSNKEPGK